MCVLLGAAVVSFADDDSMAILFLGFGSGSMDPPRIPCDDDASANILMSSSFFYSLRL